MLDQRGIVVREANADQRAAHRRAVAGRTYARELRRKEQPELYDRAQRRPSDAGRQSQQPDAQPPREAGRKPARVATGCRDRLGHHARVVGVVRAHALAESEVVAVNLGEHPQLPAPREPLAGQAERVSNRRPEYATSRGLDSLAERFHGAPVVRSLSQNLLTGKGSPPILQTFV